MFNKRKINNNSNGNSNNTINNSKVVINKISNKSNNNNNDNDNDNDDDDEEIDLMPLFKIGGTNKTLPINKKEEKQIVEEKEKDDVDIDDLAKEALHELMQEQRIENEAKKNDDDDDEMRIITPPPPPIANNKNKNNYNDDEDDEDEDNDDWAREQIARAVGGKIQSEKTEKELEKTIHLQMNNDHIWPVCGSAFDRNKILSRISTKITNLKREREDNIEKVSSIEKETKEYQEKLATLDSTVASTKKFKFYKEMEDYVYQLLDCIEYKSNMLTTIIQNHQNDNVSERDKVVSEEILHLFDDVKVEYKSIHEIKSKFDRWQKEMPDTFENAYVVEYYFAIFELFVKCEVLRWNPIPDTATATTTETTVTETTISKMDWFQYLNSINSNNNKNNANKLLSQIVQKIIKPRMIEIINNHFHPDNFDNKTIITSILKELSVYTSDNSHIYHIYANKLKAQS